MCCFSKSVKAVNSTNIFAREGEDGRQFLVYSMFLNAGSDLAMILPLPVRMPADENDVKFISLKEYADFFTEMDRGFPAATLGGSRGSRKTKSVTELASLPVVHVGDFEASFVPTVKDFSRLDERFRLPPDTWSELPQYQDYGFAVFKLKPGAMRVHPMAFSFPRREQNSLFFPTVHIHDGEVHPEAHFDHVLFCQPTGERHLSLQGKWQESFTHPKGFMQVDKTKGIVQPDQHCYKRELRGNLPNRDTLLAVQQ